MKARSTIIAAAVLTLLMCACGDDTVHLQPTKDDSAEKTAAAQGRITGAFYSSIVPKMKTCWDQVKAKGAVQFKYEYLRDRNNWVFQDVHADGSSLERSQQQATAMNCMKEAASNSTFPVEPEEIARESKEMVIYWGWPVPLPADTTQLARMITDPGGPGECPKLCKDCAWKPGQSFCASACSGFTGCSEDGTGTGCQMTRPECKTGWSGPWAGAVIAREAQ